MSDATDVVKREACCVRAGQLKERVGRRASSGLGGLGWAGRRSGKRADEASDFKVMCVKVSIFEY